MTCFVLEDAKLKMVLTLDGGVCTRCWRWVRPTESLFESAVPR